MGKSKNSRRGIRSKGNKSAKKASAKSHRCRLRSNGFVHFRKSETLPEATEPNKTIRQPEPRPKPRRDRQKYRSILYGQQDYNRPYETPLSKAMAYHDEKTAAEKKRKVRYNLDDVNWGKPCMKIQKVVDSASEYRSFCKTSAVEDTGIIYEFYNFEYEESSSDSFDDECMNFFSIFDDLYID